MRPYLLLLLAVLWCVNPALAQHVIIAPSGGGTVSPSDLAPGGSSDISATYATRAYADAIAQGLDVKLSVATSTFSLGNITLSGEQTLNTVLTSESRVLVLEQTDPATNGIYVSAAGAWARATDADAVAEVRAGMFTLDANTLIGWALTDTEDDPVVLGTTPLVFAQFSGAGEVLAGTCLDKTGNTLSVEAGCLTATQMADLGITGGKLAENTIPNSKLVDATLTGAKVANSTLTHTKMAPANLDGVAATPSLRTLGTGAQQAAAGDDARLSDQRTPLDNSVTAAKIPNSTITEDKLAFDVATQVELDAVTAASGAVALDLGNNGSTEAANITKITTAGDTNNVFTETTPNELHINVGVDWPKADLADGLVAEALTESMVSTGLLGPAASTFGFRKLGIEALEAAAGNDGRFPTSDQKAALVGTFLSPSAANPFVTDSDARVPPNNPDAVTNPPEGPCDGVEIEGVTYRLLSTWRNVDTSERWECSEIPTGSSWESLGTGGIVGGSPAPTMEQVRQAGNTITGAISEETATTYSSGGITFKTWVDPSSGITLKMTPSADKVFVLDAGTKFLIEAAGSQSPLFECTPETGCTGVTGDEENPIIPTEQQVLDVSSGRVGPFSAVKPRVLFGDTLEHVEYEQGGDWKVEFIDTATQLPIPVHVNVPAGLTKTFYGDGIDIFTLDADTATMTHHSAPLYDDGVKLTLNPNGTNAGLNFGSQAGDPSSLMNGDCWYNSSTDTFRCREGGSSKDMIGGAGGAPTAPILPSSAIPVTAGMVYGLPFDGDMMMAVTTATLLTADATWRLNFEMPPTLATGCTYKLQLDGKANAAAGVLRINPKWNTWAPGVTRASLTLNAESVTPDSVTGAAGSGDTVTWGTGDENQLLRVKWTLNASTVTAAQRIAMDLVFEDASTTLAVESGWLASVICE